MRETSQKYFTTAKFSGILLSITSVLIFGIYSTIYKTKDVSVQNRIDIEVVKNDIKNIKDDVKDIKDLLLKNYK